MFKVKRQPVVKREIKIKTTVRFHQAGIKNAFLKN